MMSLKMRKKHFFKEEGLFRGQFYRLKFTLIELLVV
jgi:hypothetical protein